MADLVMKLNDTFPQLKTVLKQVNQVTDVEEPIDLATVTSCTAIIKCPKKANIENLCTGPNAEAITKATGANKGAIEYYWRQTDLNEVGLYIVEFVIIRPESEVGHTGVKVKPYQTVPNENYREIQVVANLGEAD